MTCKKELSAVILASGRGRRFGENKLLYPINGIAMVEQLFITIPTDLFKEVIVVSIYDEILTMSEKHGYLPVHNDDTSGDIAKTIIFGINAIDRYSDGCMFFTSDQPWLTSSTIERLIGQFYNEPEKIHIPVCQEQSGNPVIFPKRFFADLGSLPPHYGGKHLVKKYPEAVSYLTVTNALELKDVDTKEDLSPVST